MLTSPLTLISVKCEVGRESRRAIGGNPSIVEGSRGCIFIIGVEPEIMRKIGDRVWRRGDGGLRLLMLFYWLRC